MFIQQCGPSLMRYRIKFQNKHVSVTNASFLKPKPDTEYCVFSSSLFENETAEAPCRENTKIKKVIFS